MASLMQNHAAFSMNFHTRLCICQIRSASRLSCSLPQESITRSSVSVDNPPSEELPGKERRKQRNARREELKGQRVSFREVFEEKVMIKPPKKLPRKQLLNMNRLEARGMQWWIVWANKNGEKVAMENLSAALSKAYPELDFEVWSALVPTMKLLSSGKYSETRRCLQPGCIYLRCVLNQDLYNFIRGVERIRGFIGSKITHRKRMVIVPSTVSKLELDLIHAKVKADEEAFALLKEEAERKMEEEKLGKNKER